MIREFFYFSKSINCLMLNTTKLLITFNFFALVKTTTSEAPTIQPTTLAQSTTEGEATETTNMIYPTTTMDSETVYTTDTIPMITDYTTLDGSATSPGESIETEFPSMESRIGSIEDGFIEGSKINILLAVIYGQL